MLNVPTAEVRLPHRIWMLWTLRTVVSVLSSVIWVCASTEDVMIAYMSMTLLWLSCTWKWSHLNEQLYCLVGKGLYKDCERAACWSVSWHQDLMPSAWCFQAPCCCKSQGLLARSEALWSFGDSVHRLIPAVTLRAYDRSDMFESSNGTWFIESGSWKLYGERRKKGEEKTMH